MKKRLGLRPKLAGLTIAGLGALAVAGIALAGAVSTTDDPGFVYSGTNASAACVHGTSTNCNAYVAKTDVYLTGLPTSASPDPGVYFFAVLDPGGQRNPNDGSGGNLSSPNDLYTARTFSIDASGTITNLGTHAFDSANNKLQVAPFTDTGNQGGVYIMAVCRIDELSSFNSNDNTYDAALTPVGPSQCKYDAFRVSTTNTAPAAEDLGVRKDATPSLTREHNWTIAKSVDSCAVVNNLGGCSLTSGTTKLLNYTVVVTKDATPFQDSAWVVGGNIYVNNPNDFDVTGVNVSDAVDGETNASCPVGSGSYTTPDQVTHSVSNPGTIPSHTEVTYSYTCTYTQKPAANTQTNRATATWGASNGLPTTSGEGTQGIVWANATITQIHDSVTVADVITSTSPALPATGFAVGAATPTNGSDPVAGTLSASKTFTYSRTLTVPHDCLTVNNTASFSVTVPDGDLDDSGSSPVTVKVCRTAALTGALTMGFWQNKNGQAIIAGYCAGAPQVFPGVTVSLYTFLTGYNPLKDLTSSTCSGEALYVYNVIKAAVAKGAAMNAMLKAQMLATALDVYFSDPALGGNKINAPHPVGGVSIDLTNICKMIDGTGGTATCSGVYYSTVTAFGGTPPCQTVSQLLTYAASQSDSGGINWYVNVKSTQELAKNTFDAINNQVAFSC